MQDIIVTDVELLRQLGTGDRTAFGKIYDRYWNRLYQAARDKVQYPENAEEIVQDIFVDLWERRETRLISDLERYLFRAVKYKVLDFIRAQIVRRQYEDTMLHLSASNGDPDTEEALAYLELKKAFSSGLESLPPKTREIFRLSRIDQLSVREISASLNIPERTVEYHISLALRVLRVYLKDFLLCMVGTWWIWLSCSCIHIG